jgi:DNA polymerase-1
MAKNKKTTLLIDVSNLAYRSLYTTGALSHQGQGTGILYGILRQAKSLHERFPDGRLVWCFDSVSSRRKNLRPSYKANRNVDLEDAAVAEARKSLREQVGLLRDKYLPALGYRNIFWREGYEADDVIASLCGTVSGRLWIVSSDNDLLQLLDGDRVMLLNPKGGVTTEQAFTARWGIKPSSWAAVKAIAGCSGDNVIGVRGVGEKTAAKYLLNKMKPESKIFRAICGSVSQIRENMILVKLPFDGVGYFDVYLDELSDVRWQRVCRALGMRSLDY